MAEYDAVLFDMDGVLLHGRATPAAIYRRAAAETITTFGLDPSPAQRAVLAQHEYDDAFDVTCRELDVTPDAFWSTREEKAANIAHDRMRDGHRRAHDDTTVLAELAPPLGLVSNNRHATVSYVANRYFPDRFSVARGRDPTIDGYQRRKPDPYYIEEVLLLLDAETALYVGDRETDVRAATAAGIDAALLRRSGAGTSASEVEPTVELEHLTELTSVPGIPTKD